MEMIYAGMPLGKRLHLHSIPLVLAVVGVTGLLVIAVQASRGDALAQAFIRPAVGAGTYLFDIRARAVLSSASVIEERAGAAINVQDPVSESQESLDAISLHKTTRMLGIQLALDTPPRAALPLKR